MKTPTPLNDYIVFHAQYMDQLRELAKEFYPYGIPVDNGVLSTDYASRDFLIDHIMKMKHGLNYKEQFHQFDSKHYWLTIEELNIMRSMIESHPDPFPTTLHKGLYKHIKAKIALLTDERDRQLNEEKSLDCKISNATSDKNEPESRPT